MGEYALSNAINRKDLTMINRLISSGNRPTPSHIAACVENNLIEVMEQFLINDNNLVNSLYYTGETLLVECVLQKRLGLCEVLIKYNCNVNYADTYGYTALHRAVILQYHDIAEILLRASANPNSTAIKNITPLISAIRNVDVPMIRLLKSYGVDMERKTSKRAKPVHEINNADVMQIFIDAIKDVDVRDNDGRTPLMLAAIHGYPDIVAMLLKAGARKELRDRSNRDSVCLAVCNNHAHVLEILLGDGYDVTPTIEYPNPVFIAVELDREYDLIKRLIDVTSDEDLLRCNVDLNTLLHLAVVRCRLDLIPLLIRRGLDVYVKNSNGQNALNLATQADRLDVVIELLKENDIINAYEMLMEKIEYDNVECVKALVKCGVTIEREHIEAAIKISNDIEYNFNINEVNRILNNSSIRYLLINSTIIDSDNYLIALEYAKYNYEAVFSFLVFNDIWKRLKFSKENPIHIFINKDNYFENWLANKRISYSATYLFNKLINGKRNDVDSFNSLNKSDCEILINLISKIRNNEIDVLNRFLEKFIYSGREDLAVFLIQHNVSAPLKDADLLSHCRNHQSERFNDLLVEMGVVPPAKGVLPLQQLSRNALRSNYNNYSKSRTKYRKIIEYQTIPYNINTIAKHRQTPLQMAMVKNDFDTFIYLLENGADPDMKNTLGSSPLHYLNMNNNKFMKELIKHGADVKSITKSNYTPLMFAAFYDNIELVVELLRAGSEVNAVNIKGNSALHLLSYQRIDGNTDFITDRKNAADIATVLLNHGADFRILNDEGVTPMMLAARFSTIDVVTVLLKAGSDVNIAGCKDVGNTALHLLAYRFKDDKNENTIDRQRECADIADLLLRYGADHRLRNNNGFTPLELMQCIGYHNELLLKVLIDAEKIKSNITLIEWPKIYAYKQ